MGTNYYIEENKCKCCNRSEKVHIGKRSWGWEFCFRSHEEKDIRSWKEWKNYIVELGEVIDEAGDVISAEEFIKIVENSKKLIERKDGTSKQPSNHYDYCLEKRYDVDKQWKDADGWSFSNFEFA